jgi:putative nucleotidyltransferase with HDIG domain
MKHKIIISDTDFEWAQDLAGILETKSFDSSIVSNGKNCQLEVYKEKIFAVVLNLDTHNNNGLEVLRYMRLNAPSVKVVLVINDKKRLEEIGCDNNELKQFGASAILVKPFSFEKILESIEGDNHFELWRDMEVSDSSKGEEAVSAKDHEFTKIKIRDFLSGNATIFDCYIKLGENNYLKILHRGDFFEEERLKEYISSKNVVHLYFKTKDRSIYINFINNILENMINKKGESSTRKVKTASNLTDKYIEEIYTSGLKPQLINEGKRICENIYKLIEKENDLSSIMSVYSEENPSEFAHLFLTSFLAIIACKHLSWASERTVEIIAMGALLHDIGMIKMPDSVKSKTFSSMTDDEKAQYKEHPRIGAELLQRYKLITEPIRQIVYQHHEYVNGSGYPNGLNGIKIYPLAKVVCFSSDFATYLSELKMSPIKGLRELIKDEERIKKYSPEVIKAFIKAFI